MLKTIAVIAGGYAITEIGFYLGIGYALGYVTKVAPNVGKAIHDHYKIGAEGTQLSWYRRMMIKLIFAGEKMYNTAQ